MHSNTYSVSFPSLTTNFATHGVGWNQQFAYLQETLGNTDVKYPPHNIIKTDENSWLIELALAGFNEDDLSITVQNGVLTVKGEGDDSWHEGRTFLHHGIKIRNFEKKFSLAEHVEVEEAHHSDGLLSITLKLDLPKELQPKVIKIK